MSPNTLSQNPAPSAREDDRPVKPEVLELLVALDRLLSVGSYYTPTHDRYKQVAREAEAAVRKVLGPLPALEIEISNEGFYIQDQDIPADAREARRLFELFNPLNIAMLELRAGVTALDLHEALTVFKKLKTTLSGSQIYDEIHIDGLPETISTTDRSLYVRTRHRAVGPDGTRPTNATQDYQVIPDSRLVGTPDGQEMERKFLSIINGIMRGSDPTKLKDLKSKDEKEKAVGEWIPDSAILSIKEILASLAETNSDPMMFEHLISHAHSALEMTGDPELVELVFERLRKDTTTPKRTKPLLASRPKPKDPKKRPIAYMMSVEQMREIMYSLENRAVPYEDLLGPSTADALGICMQVMGAAPTEQLAGGIATTIYRILSAQNLPDDDFRVLAGSLAGMLNSDQKEVPAQVLPMVFSPLRRYHPGLVGPLWVEIWRGLDADPARLRAWPYVVNDMLLGMEWEDPAKRLALYEMITRVDIGDGVDMLEQLEEMQALQEEKIAPEIFHAPAPLLYPVHMVLLRSLAAEEHGPRLHKRLAHQRGNLLSDLLVRIMGDYHGSNANIYQAILEQGVTERVAPFMREVATRFLCAALESAEPEERKEFWVLDAINWLGRLDVAWAAPVLTGILKEKKLLVWPVWPSDCRRAARDALESYVPDEDDPEPDSAGDER